MKNRNKTLIILLALLLITTVLSEAGILDFYHCSSTPNIKTKSHWDNNTYSIIDVLEPLRIEGNQGVDEIPVKVIIDKEVMYEKKGKGDTLTINVAGLNTFFAWMPLYKTSKIKTKATVSYTVNCLKTKGITYNAKPGLKLTKGNVTGTINVTGDITIKGFCSHRTAKEMLGKAIAEKLTEATQQNLASLDK